MLTRDTATVCHPSARHPSDRTSDNYIPAETVTHLMTPAVEKYS